MFPASNRTTMQSRIHKLCDSKKQRKLDWQRFNRRRHSLFKKAFEVSKIWKDATTYVLIQKDRQYYVYSSRSKEEAGTWPPSPESLSKTWPQPKEYTSKHYVPRGSIHISEDESTLSDIDQDSGLMTPRESQSPEPRGRDWYTCFWHDLLEVPCPPTYPVF